MKHRHSAVVLSVVAAAALLVSPALSAPKVQVVPVKEGARLMVGGKLITLFRASNGGLSPEERAQTAAERLEELIGDGLTPTEIEARPRGAGWGVYARGGLVMIATPDEAELRHEEPEETARRWAINLKSALPGAVTAASRGKSGKTRLAKAHVAKPKRGRKPAKPAEPTLAVVDQDVAVPAGETRTVTLKGTATGPLTVSVEGEAVTARPVPGKAAVELKGLVPGQATVRVERGGKTVSFDAWVKKYAGRVLETAQAEVTGVTSPAPLVRRVAHEHLLDGIDREPGAVVRLAGQPEGIRALAQGRTAEISFPVTITGEGYLPVKAVARVRVKNVSLPAEEIKTLLYSNNPESVKQHGTLFEGALEPAGAARLFYHHQNRMGKAFVFQIHLLNPNDDAAAVQVVQADAGPILNTIQVGHRAATLYLAQSQQDIGYVTRIPAHGSRLLFSTSLPNNLTVSGIYNLRTVEGGPLIVRVSAADEVQRPKAEPDRLAAARCEPDIYSTPEKDERYEYTVGENWTFI
ncbi:MAG TPA: hypothetical protein VFU47_17915, partial [Armatimonadota bacterium]|nr:hypothetical protein [Armatimonadota bacterium]